MVGSNNRIKYDDIYCWSDSEIALAWIRGKERSWEPWVENRVITIQAVADRNRWNFVKGELNPADIPTRVSSNVIESFSWSWFQGPSMLKLDVVDVNSLSGRVDVEVDVEQSTEIPDAMATKVVANLNNSAQDNTKDSEMHSLCSVIDCNKFSSLKKLIVTTGYVLRFIKNLRKRITKQENLITDDVLTVAEFNEALQLWIKDEQHLMKKQENYANIRSSLRLFESEDGLLRLQGRCANSSLQYQEQYPIILRNKDSHFTRLIISDAHETSMHHGVETTLARIRSKYWIVKGRKSVKEVLRKCVTCTRYQGLPMRPPPSPDLPDFRVEHSAHAFQATGLDFAGPLFVKGPARNNKTYILLLTCASSRVVHLELITNMSVDGFLRGFKRFVARRGIPDLIINDNFKTFKSAEVKKFMLLVGVTQKFILPASPWWGGFYERLVRSVKTCLKKTIGRALVTYKELQTVLCEVEVDFVFPSDVDQCKRRLNHIRKVLKDFWMRFRCTYLNELRQMNIYRKSKSKNVRSITVGDVALIRDDDPVPRAKWRMGQMLGLVKGPDGQVRGAQLAVLSNLGKRTTVFRPLQKLIPFLCRQ